MDKKLLEEGRELYPQFEKRGGLLPVIVQDYQTKEILMLAYANQEALDETLKTGYATFWSTSKGEMWIKGKTSGDMLRIEEVKEILTDCDQDAFVYKVERLKGGACHTKNSSGQSRESCFYRRLAGGKLEFLEK
jgi:phosphoribosyl-AMP cyclohydrolase